MINNLEHSPDKTQLSNIVYKHIQYAGILHLVCFKRFKWPGWSHSSSEKHTTEKWFPVNRGEETLNVTFQCFALSFVPNGLVIMNVGLSIPSTQESCYRSLHRGHPWRFDFKSQAPQCVFPADKKSVRAYYMTPQREVKQMQENAQSDQIKDFVS